MGKGRRLLPREMDTGGEREKVTAEGNGYWWVKGEGYCRRKWVLVGKRRRLLLREMGTGGEREKVTAEGKRVLVGERRRLLLREMGTGG